MQKVNVYFRSVSDCSYEVKSFYVDDWYVKPSILSSLSYYFHKESNGCCVFVCSGKYGCRQFLPEQSKLFPISRVLIVGPDSVTQSLVMVFGK